MESIEKVVPINKLNDKKKQFYVISDNLIRFYFTYILGDDTIIKMLGEEVFYDTYIEKSIDEFIQRRFEDIVVQYFKCKVRSLEIKGVKKIGSYWYDIPSESKNGEFDVVLQKSDGYQLYECKFFDRKMTREECQQEEKQVNQITELNCIKLGFVNVSGFNFEDDGYELIEGEELLEKILEPAYKTLDN